MGRVGSGARSNEFIRVDGLVWWGCSVGAGRGSRGRGIVRVEGRCTLGILHACRERSMFIVRLKASVCIFVARTRYHQFIFHGQNVYFKANNILHYGILRHLGKCVNTIWHDISILKEKNL